MYIRFLFAQRKKKKKERREERENRFISIYFFFFLCSLFCSFILFFLSCLDYYYIRVWVVLCVCVCVLHIEEARTNTTTTKQNKKKYISIQRENELLDDLNNNLYLALFLLLEQNFSSINIIYITHLGAAAATTNDFYDYWNFSFSEYFVISPFLQIRIGALVFLELFLKHNLHRHFEMTGHGVRLSLCCREKTYGFSDAISFCFSLHNPQATT